MPAKSKKKSPKNKSVKKAPKKPAKKTVKKSSTKLKVLHGSAVKKAPAKKVVKKQAPSPKAAPKKKPAELNLLDDHLIRTGAVAAFALFTLILIMPISPCKISVSQPGDLGETYSYETWGMCGQDGWSSLSVGYSSVDAESLWLGAINLGGPERWFIFAGLFGFFYLAYLKLYTEFVKHLSA